MKPTVVAVVGSKKSGKTTTIEILVRGLTGRGYKVAVAKHVPEPNFTIDTERKDTWRFAQSGAKTIVAVSAKEIATIEKGNTENLSLAALLKKCEGSDVVFLEGFRKLVARNKNIHKIAVVTSREETEEALRSFEPILAFTGPYEAKSPKVPYINSFRNPDEIVDIIKRLIKKKRT